MKKTTLKFKIFLLHEIILFIPFPKRWENILLLKNCINIIINDVIGFNIKQYHKREFSLHSSISYLLKIMAESLLFTVAESLIGKLTSRAIEEASLTLGVYRDLQDMKDKMALIKAFMLDAEHKKPHNNVLSEWLRQIKHVFSDAEDIVDDFECTALRKRVVNMVAAQVRYTVSSQLVILLFIV